MLMSVVYQYQEPAGPTVSDPKSKKKFFLLVGLGVAIVATMVVVLVVGSSRSVQKSEQPQNTPASRFVAAVLSEDASALASLYKDGSEANKAGILANTKVVKSNLKLETCQSFGNPAVQGDYAQYLFRCTKSEAQQILDNQQAGEDMPTTATLVVTSERDKIIFYQVVSGRQTYYAIEEVADIIAGKRPLINTAESE